MSFIRCRPSAVLPVLAAYRLCIPTQATSCTPRPAPIAHLKYSVLRYFGIYGLRLALCVMLFVVVPLASEAQQRSIDVVAGLSSHPNSQQGKVDRYQGCMKQTRKSDRVASEDHRQDSKANKKSKPDRRRSACNTEGAAIQDILPSEARARLAAAQQRQASEPKDRGGYIPPDPWGDEETVAGE